MDEWIESITQEIRTFSEVPERYQKVLVRTNHGIFKAKYSPTQLGGGKLYFDIKAPAVAGGYIVYAWKPLSEEEERNA